jgi:predicted DNA-binding transcriptional regulator YafY
MTTGAGAELGPAERVLRLAAFAGDRCAKGGEITLTDIVDGVGYDTDAPRDARNQIVSEGRPWEKVRKMVQRDLRDLREHWGIHLDYDDASHSYRLEPPFFTPDERRALLAAQATVAVEGLAHNEPGDLGAALDDRRALVVLRLHDLVAALRAARAERRVVTFGLYGATRHVQPYALGLWRNRWYLAGHDVDRDELRRYRLDRIDMVESAGPPGAYVIPDDLDRETLFDLDPNAWGDDPAVRAHVRVGIDHVETFLAELGGDVVERSTTDAVVALDVRHYVSFRNRLLAFRGSAVVIDPPVLADEVRDHLAALTSGND